MNARFLTKHDELRRSREEYEASQKGPDEELALVAKRKREKKERRRAAEAHAAAAAEQCELEAAMRVKAKAKADAEALATAKMEAAIRAVHKQAAQAEAAEAARTQAAVAASREAARNRAAERAAQAERQRRAAREERLARVAARERQAAHERRAIATMGERRRAQREYHLGHVGVVGPLALWIPHGWYRAQAYELRVQCVHRFSACLDSPMKPAHAASKRLSRLNTHAPHTHTNGSLVLRVVALLHCDGSLVRLALLGKGQLARGRQARHEGLVHHHLGARVVEHPPVGRDHVVLAEGDALGQRERLVPAAYGRRQRDAE